MKNLFSISLLSLFLLIGCTKKQGCTDSSAQNYDANAEVDNGTCTYSNTNTTTNSNGNSNTTTNVGTNSTTPLRVSNGWDIDTVDYSSVLYKMIGKFYYVHSLNGVVDANPAIIRFSDTELSIGEYEVDDNKSTNNIWFTVDAAGTKFRYPQLGGNNYAYSAEVEIVSYDNVSGEIMAVYWRSSYATTQDTIIMRRN